MSLQHHFLFPLRNGFHARPASALEEVSRRFASEMTLANQRTSVIVNGKSVLSILSADIRLNDACVLTISGPDEQAALAAMTSFLNDRLPHCDDALPPVPAQNGKWHLPPGLSGAGLTIHRGVPVAPGIGQGRIVHAAGFKIPAPLATASCAEDPEAEWLQLDEALQKLIASHDEQLAGCRKRVEMELLKAHRAIARDSELRRQLHDAVRQRQRTAAAAIAETEEHFTKLLGASASQLLRERAVDIQDVCSQLLRQLHGAGADAGHCRLTGDSIVVADTLAPSQFLALDRGFLKGLVLGRAGATSHTVILARSFGVPTLTGVEDLAGAREGCEAVVDSDAGALVTHLTKSARRYYAMERQRLSQHEQRVKLFARGRAATRDGRHIEVAANISSAEETPAVFEAGAEGVGLFRTEMLFLDRASAPDEEEQLTAYRRVLEAAAGRTVVIRTLDVGGDKPLDYLKLPVEENPFLGHRAVRIYPEFEPLFRTQIRALVRASAHGRLQVMVPMVATLEEVRWVKNIIAQEQAGCAAAGLAFDAAMPLGAMIEVPAAAFALDALCRELDFFSIGSNDLLQYFMAADRANERVGALYNPLQPAFLRLLHQIVAGVHAHKKTAALCGEMGGQSRYLPLLVGLGLEKISVAAPAIANLKAELAGLDYADCRQLLSSALDCATADEVAALLEQFASRHGAPLLDPELVVMDSDAVTKEEAIKQAVDRLYVLGRTENPRAVEEAVWQREAVYSTGFGYGFAFPHCKSGHVKSSSLVLLKLRAPAVWNSLDNEPVRVVILLAVHEPNGANEHMKIFARLARQMMDENFRARLESETDREAVCAYLRKILLTEND